MSILNDVLKKLGLENTNIGLERLSEKLCINFGVKISVDDLKVLGRQSPTAPVLDVMKSLPCVPLLSTDEECQVFYNTFRETARRSGFDVQEAVPGKEFRC